MTFATTSSFLSNGVVDGFFIFVRAAKRSVEVAPRHNAKSIVEDYTHLSEDRKKKRKKNSHSASSTRLQ